MRTMEEFHTVESYDENTGTFHLTIKNCAGEIVYESSYKVTSRGNRPYAPIDYLRAALNGEQIVIIPSYHDNLVAITHELHMLNACETDEEKESPSFARKLRKQFKVFISIFKLI